MWPNLGQTVPSRDLKSGSKNPEVRSCWKKITLLQYPGKRLLKFLLIKSLETYWVFLSWFLVAFFFFNSVANAFSTVYPRTFLCSSLLKSPRYFPRWFHKMTFQTFQTIQFIFVRYSIFCPSLQKEKNVAIQSSSNQGCIEKFGGGILEWLSLLLLLQIDIEPGTAAAVKKIKIC